MKRFRFPLRPVAVLRSHKESRAQEAFAAAVHAFVQSEEALARVRAKMAELEKVLFAGRHGQFRPSEAASFLAAYRQECAAEASAEQAVNAARAEMQIKREDYIQAHRELEVIKRLEEKARAAHRLESNREEQAEFDDFASRRFGRRIPSSL